MTESWDGDAVTDGGLFASNTLLKGGDVVDFTPIKSQPAWRLQKEDGESIDPNARGVVEIVAEVDEDSLIAFNSSTQSRLEQRIEERVEKADPGELVICFWKYEGSSPISKVNAQRLVRLSEEYSDYVMPPLQDKLLYAHRYDRVDADVNQADDEVHRIQNHDRLRLYRIGVERYLEAAEATDQLIGAPVPFLRDDAEWVQDRLWDYSEMEIDLLCYNMMRRKPTSDANREFIEKLTGYLRRIGYFDPTLKYAVNVCHSYRNEKGERSAEDIALAGMGFDIIGENYWAPPREDGIDYQRLCRVFSGEDLIYHETIQSRDELAKVWPSDRTQWDFGTFLNAHLTEELIRQERLLNSEQVELTLRELRSSIESEEAYEFLQSYDGYELIGESMREIADEYADPTPEQFEIGDFD